MRKTLALGAAFLGATLAFAPAAMAASPKTFVSATGNDSNTATNCSKNDPCRGFAAAYSVTNVGGTIVAIDTGVYGQLTITGAVTLMAAPGVTAEVLVPPGGSGFTINAGSSDLVVLRNLTIFGTTGPTTGITHNNGRLVVQDSSFKGLSVGIDSTYKSAIIDSDFYNNTVGLRVTGQGTDYQGTGSMNACVAACSIVTRGSFVGNATALSSVAVGAGKFGILIRSAGTNDYLTNFVFNAIYHNNPDNANAAPGYIEGLKNILP